MVNFQLLNDDFEEDDFKPSPLGIIIKTIRLNFLTDFSHYGKSNLEWSGSR